MTEVSDVTAPRPEAPKKKKSAQTKILIAGGIFVAAYLVIGDPPVYFAKSISGQVVDDATGKPLPGVVVVAEWLLESNISAGSGSRVSLKTLEITSDENGRYEFPAWGPRIRPPGLAFIDRDPNLTYFKTKYYTQSHTNGWRMVASRNRSLFRSANLDGQTVRMKPFDGDWNRYWNSVEGGWSLFWGCTYECPRLVAGIVDENAFIISHAPRELHLFPLVQIGELPAPFRKIVEGVRPHEN